jgi:hypothetical protein
MRPENGQWLVKKLGGKSRIFSGKDQAIEVAKRKAASKCVGVLVFEGGHVSEVSRTGTHVFVNCPFDQRYLPPAGGLVKNPRKNRRQNLNYGTNA